MSNMKQRLSSPLSWIVVVALLTGGFMVEDLLAQDCLFHPDDLELIQLSDAESFAPDFREMAQTVAGQFEGTETPAESFWASLREEESVVVFQLWHESAFEPENCNSVGNPGGLCRDVHVDRESGQIVATYFWQ